MVAWDMHADWAYEGGAFRLADNLAWGIQMAAEAARRRQDFIAHQALYAASRNLPLDEELPTHPRVLRGYARYSHYDDWLGNPLPGGYWDGISPRALLADKPVDVPMLFIGGWFDQMLTGTLDAFREISQRSPAPHRLLVGPWTHMPWGRRAGSRRFRRRSGQPRSMRSRSRGSTGTSRAKPVAERPAVELFDLGTRQWLGYDALPAPEPTPLHISSTGLAAVSTEDGRLTPEPVDGAPSPIVSSTIPGGRSPASAAMPATTAACATARRWMNAPTSPATRRNRSRRRCT